MRPKTRGLETVVAAVLLVVVAVIGAVLVYLWFAGYVTKATSLAEQMAATEKLKIEAAMLDAFTEPAADVTLYVRNLTNLPVRWSSLYVLQAGTNVVVCDPTDLTIVEVVEYTRIGDVVKIKTAVNCLQPLTEGYDYTIKLVTARGTEIAVTVTAS